ncbi:hypothetical protein BCR34DRAFT_636977, partial [Clohesyomyces aquaticus]
SYTYEPRRLPRGLRWRPRHEHPLAIFLKLGGTRHLAIPCRAPNYRPWLTLPASTAISAAKDITADMGQIMETLSLCKTDSHIQTLIQLFSCYNALAYPILVLSKPHVCTPSFGPADQAAPNHHSQNGFRIEQAPSWFPRSYRISVRIPLLMRAAMRRLQSIQLRSSPMPFSNRSVICSAHGRKVITRDARAKTISIYLGAIGVPSVRFDSLFKGP